MKKKKVQTLYKFKSNQMTSDCLALIMLYYKEAQYIQQYNEAKDSLNRKQVKSKSWTKQLTKVRKLFTRKQTITTIIAEIENTKKLVENVATEDIYRVFNVEGDNDYKRSCKGKVKYSENSATQAAIDVSDKLNEDLESYKCRYCDGWHIGHCFV